MLGLGGVGQVAGRLVYTGLAHRASLTARTAAVFILVTASTLVLAVVPGPVGLLIAASMLAVAGELLLLIGVIRWSNTDLARVGTLTLAVIIFQALLGMWTVTWLLKPIVVMAHLLGGLLTFSLLTWMAWRATDIPIRIADAAKLRRLLIVGLVLLGVQIALGG